MTGFDLHPRDKCWRFVFASYGFVMSVDPLHSESFSEA